MSRNLHLSFPIGVLYRDEWVCQAFLLGLHVPTGGFGYGRCILLDDGYYFDATHLLRITETVYTDLLVVAILSTCNLEEDGAVVYLAQVILVDNAVFRDEEVGKNPFHESGHYKSRRSEAKTGKTPYMQSQLTIASLMIIK